MELCFNIQISDSEDPAMEAEKSSMTVSSYAVELTIHVYMAKDIRNRRIHDRKTAATALLQ